MASFFSKLLSGFGAGATKETPQKAPESDPHVHGDYTIYATPLREGSQYRLAGRIEKAVDGQTLTHEFVRADVFTSLDDAKDCTIRKAKLIIDQSGKTLFADKK